METSESIGQLALSLAKAQGMMQGAKKDSSNPFFRSKYADLASIWDACREPLAKNELAIIQIPQADGIETILAHSSGEWIKGFLKIAPAKNDAQSIGSALTYARRYALAAMVGIAPEDDDGNAASAVNSKTNTNPAVTTKTANNNGLKDKINKALDYMFSKGYSLDQLEKWVGYPTSMWQEKDLDTLKQQMKAGVKPEVNHETPMEQINILLDAGKFNDAEAIYNDNKDNFTEEENNKLAELFSAAFNEVE